MKTRTIKDNSQYGKATFADIPALTARIADKTTQQLEQEGIFIFPEFIREAEDIDAGQMILRSVNDKFSTGNIMGFLGCGDERLTIESRFGGERGDFFLQYMLHSVLKFPNMTDLETDANQDNRIFHFLLFLFPQYLKGAMRKGLFKQYILRRCNDMNVKGAIDVARHIARNTPFIGNVAYNQREFSYDNSLMELVRHTIEYIQGKRYGKRLLEKVRDEVQLVKRATPAYALRDRQKIIHGNQKNIVRHAYYREYMALQKLCLLILQNQKHQIGVGTWKIYGILFDGAWLWEEYIYALIGDAFYHPRNRNGEGAQRLFGGNIGLIYPDFIGKRDTNRVIADAKYKPMDNIGNRDYLQLLAYMFRFDAKTGYDLYPEADEADDLILWLNRGSTYERNVMPRDDISIIKHGLKIPQKATCFNDFADQMAAAEQTFKTAFAEYNQPGMT